MPELTLATTNLEAAATAALPVTATCILCQTEPPMQHRLLVHVENQVHREITRLDVGFLPAIRHVVVVNQLRCKDVLPPYATLCSAFSARVAP